MLNCSEIHFLSDFFPVQVCLGEMNTQETNITSDSQTSAEWDNSDCNISHWNDEQKLILDESIM